MTDSLKQKIRAELYRRPTDNELIESSGKPHIRHNRLAKDKVSSKAYQVDVMEFTIANVIKVSKGNAEITAILDYTPKDVELVKLFGVSKQNVYGTKKNYKEGVKSHGYLYYLHSYHIDKIAKLVGV